MSKAADGTTEAPSDLPDDTNAMHTDRTEVQNAAATWRYDASSGRTIERESVWITRGRKGKRDAGGKTTQEATPTKEATSTQQSQPQRRKPTMPPLPFDDYKVVYRPQAGLELAKWNNIAIVHAIGKASGFAQQDFSEKVCVQVQRLENLIIASTAEWEDAKKLESITSIQLGGTLFTIKSNTRTPDDVSRGVISGLLPGTSEEELKAGLRAPARYTVLHARMLGQSSTAVIFFQGPHVPYYVRFHSLDFRCRPYRKSVQYCKTCGNTGHRQDVCPRPLPGFCSKCGKTNQPPDHVCKPACKLCGEEHETASKDCKKRLKPNPPPFHIRQQRMDRIKARDCRWSLADEEFPELTSQTTNLHSSADGAPTRGRSRSALRPRSRSRSRSRSCSPKREAGASKWSKYFSLNFTYPRQPATTRINRTWRPLITDRQTRPPLSVSGNGTVAPIDHALLPYKNLSNKTHPNFWHCKRRIHRTCGYMDTTRTTQQRQNLCRLVHNCAGSEKNILRESEHLILKSRTRGRPAAYSEPDPNVTLSGKPIPKVETLRVLGLHIHKDGSGAATLPRLQRTLSQLTHLVRRIANRRSGLKEQDTLRVMQALLSSRITYGTPYLALKNAEAAVSGGRT
ncbi:hypothetical protein HPB50_010653 [Hyalomma asiaticum]|uniref:Uncharacterized protein n=1 Tax=Hyalomma asiaticum TaxID=266040 RepID=A0ACB7T928_HYAAI|nr:hypothetical protein HPB50_010653 [Hyalomma asiaticum]